MFKNIKWAGVEIAIGEAKDGTPLAVEYCGNFQGYAYRLYAGTKVAGQSDSLIEISAKFYKKASQIIEDFDR